VAQKQQHRQQQEHDKYNKGPNSRNRRELGSWGFPLPFRQSGNEGNNEMKFTNKRQPTIVFIAFCRCRCRRLLLRMRCNCVVCLPPPAVMSFCPFFTQELRCQTTTTPNNIIPAYCQRRWFFNKNVIHLLLLLLPDGDLVSREKPLGCDPST